jgi:hypothetical protein
MDEDLKALARELLDLQKRQVQLLEADLRERNRARAWRFVYPLTILIGLGIGLMWLRR